MTQHILSLSYGKDSMACLFAIEKLGWPLDRIIHAEIWATDTIPADLPPMVEFKAKADKIIKERWGIEVEHVTALKPQRESFESLFYRRFKSGKHAGRIMGFPMRKGNWCTSILKCGQLDIQRCVLQEKNVGKILRSNPRIPNDKGAVVPRSSESECSGCSQTFSDNFSGSANQQGANINSVVSYVGIATDEPERLARLDGITKISPLVAIGWTEADCFKICEENGLLSPIYLDSTRGGCWFCHNQSVDQLRKLRKNYPDLWALLLKWDSDSPVSFHADGKTVHDFDARFKAEDDGAIPTDKRFRWKLIDGRYYADIVEKKKEIL